MKILRETTDYQSLLVLPSRFPNALVTISLTKEDTDVETDITGLSSYTENGYLKIRAIFGTVENNFYSLRIIDGGEEIYKGKIFCTNQEKYSINNGTYVTVPRETKYIIYEK